MFHSGKARAKSRIIIVLVSKEVNSDPDGNVRVIFMLQHQ